MRPAPILPCPGSLAHTSASCWKNSRPSGKRPGSRHCASGAAGTGGGQPEPGPSSDWCSPTGCWSRWCICGWAFRTRHWPSCTGWTAPPSPERSAKSDDCWPPAASQCPTAPELRLRTLEDLFAYAAAEGVELRLDGTEVQVRRPCAGRPGRKAFVSGKKKQNTIKTTTFSDAQGRTLFSGIVRPGRMHDQTAARTEGIAEQLRRHPTVKAEVDEGYRGLANEFPDQVSAPPRKPKDDTPLGDHHAWREQRRRQSSARIRVEHANAELKQWRPLQRFTGQRETYAETHLAIAGLVSDRSARRATRRKTSTELVLIRQTAC